MFGSFSSTLLHTYARKHPHTSHAFRRNAMDVRFEIQDVLDGGPAGLHSFAVCRNNKKKSGETETERMFKMIEP